jgi:hypothetical protein
MADETAQTLDLPPEGVPAKSERSSSCDDLPAVLGYRAR